MKVSVTVSLTVLSTELVTASADVVVRVSKVELVVIVAPDVESPVESAAGDVLSSLQPASKVGATAQSDQRPWNANAVLRMTGAMVAAAGIRVAVDMK
ncbi:MAG: hypothetical protein IPK74_24645 [Deltaproteobacteria bacterium]|nr:hypothetical protein [Deltaproteobacteria bacterium]